MKLAKRFFSLLQSRTAQLIDRAETPDEKFNNFINEMNGRLEELRDAVAERQKIERLGVELHSAWKIQQKAVEGLKAEFEAVRAGTTSARAEFQVSMAKFKAAEAQHSLDGGSPFSSGDNPLVLLEQINEKILKLEAETEANKLLDTNGSQTVEAAFRELERKRSVDDELNRLKTTLALPQSETTSGSNLIV